MNNELTTWAARWGIPRAAINELLAVTGADTTPQDDPRSETAVQQQVRLSASRAGIRLWRNNNGVAENPNGQPVRYGLANESKKLNATLKSSDLIGITPVIICPEHLGQVVGVFTAVEVKKGDWKFQGEDRETAQLKFILLVRSMGGIGVFNRSGVYPG